MVIRTKQQGIVLIIALLVLVTLTVVASTLMKNTTIDIKISGANQEKWLATQEAINAINDVTVNQVNGINYFALTEADYPYNIALGNSNINANIELVNNQSFNVNCAHSNTATSINMIYCNHFIVTVRKKYGRSYNQSIVVKAGVSQQIVKEGN